MPTHRIAPDASSFASRADKLLDVATNITVLAPQHSTLVAEVLMLRVFSLMEGTLASIACKLHCGASYVDGSVPLLLIPRCKHVIAALDQMRTYGRPKPRQLSWTKGGEIKKNTKYALDAADPLYSVCDAHAVMIDEMRRVRNHIAHYTRSTRQNFDEVIRRHYGAKVNSVTPGKLLLSPRRAPPLLQVYIRNSKVLVKEFARA